MFAEVVEFIQKVGFPIFICIWFLFRIEKRLDRLFEIVQRLLLSTEILVKSMEDRNEIIDKIDHRPPRQRRLTSPTGTPLPPNTAVPIAFEEKKI